MSSQTSIPPPLTSDEFNVELMISIKLIRLRRVPTRGSRRKIEVSRVIICDKNTTVAAILRVVTGALGCHVRDFYLINDSGEIVNRELDNMMMKLHWRIDISPSAPELYSRSHFRLRAVTRREIVLEEKNLEELEGKVSGPWPEYNVWREGTSVIYQEQDDIDPQDRVIWDEDEILSQDFITLRGTTCGQCLGFDPKECSKRRACVGALVRDVQVLDGARRLNALALSASYKDEDKNMDYREDTANGNPSGRGFLLLECSEEIKPGKQILIDYGSTYS